MGYDKAEKALSLKRFCRVLAFILVYTKGGTFNITAFGYPFFSQKGRGYDRVLWMAINARV